MKYHFEPYETKVENGTFSLPAEFLEKISGRMVYVYRHPKGITVVGDSSYVEYLWDDSLNIPEPRRQKAQRYMLSRLSECTVDDIVETLVRDCGFALGETVKVQSGSMTVVILREGQDI